MQSILVADKKKKKRRKREALTDNELSLAMARIELRAQVASQVVRWVGATFCVGLFAYFGMFKPIEILAGQVTLADIDINTLTSTLR